MLTFSTILFLQGRVENITKCQ